MAERSPRQRTKPLLLTAAVAAAMATLAGAQDAPIAGAFGVESTPAATQTSPDVAYAADGRFLAAWTDLDQEQHPSIYGRLFEASGVASGPEFHLAATADRSRRRPRVAAMPDGGWYVVWEVNGQSSWDIEGQRLAADGSLLHQIPINQVATNAQVEVDLDVSGDGDLIVVWSSAESEGIATIRARRIDRMGSALGDEFAVSEGSACHTMPRVAARADGGFVVVWKEDFLAPDATSRILVRRFGPDGSPSGPQFDARFALDGPESEPDVAMRDSGEFVVVWKRRLPGSTVSLVEAQRFDRFGLAAANLANVGFSNADQSDPAVALDALGRFLVTWHAPQPSTRGLPQVERSLYVARFLASGEAPSDLYIVRNQVSEIDRGSVSLGPNGDFVVVWQELFDIVGRRYRTNRVGDRVWHDVDGDGRQTVGEPGVAGISVHLYSQTGDPLGSRVTDAEGIFDFDVVPPQSVFLGFELPPSGWAFTVPDAGIGVLDFSDSDADPDTGQTISFALSAGVWTTRWDAGLVAVAFFADGFETGDTSAWSGGVP